MSKLNSVRNLIMGLIGLTASQMVGADSFGRLFFTPQERLQLERQKQQSEILPEQPTSTPTQIKLNGLVKRSSGKSTVWINQQAQDETQRSANIRALPQQAQVPVVPLIVSKDKSVRLKVGQVYDPATGAIKEGYEANRPIEAPPETSPAK